MDIEELEWYSNCCNAPPHKELHHEEEDDKQPIGLCMKCKEGAIFYIGEWEDDSYE